MPTVLVCCAVPLDSDRLGSANGTGDPDHALVFWNEHCVADVLLQLQENGLAVVERREWNTSVADVLEAARNVEDLQAVLVFGHGEPAPAPRIVWSRRKEPRNALFNEEAMRAVARAGQVLLACFSLAHFEEEAAKAGVPVLVGFRRRARTPSILDVFRDVFPAARQQELMKLYHILFRDLVVALLLSASQCKGDLSALRQEWHGHVQECRRRLQDAAKHCLRLYHETQNPHYVSQQRAFLCNAEVLDCVPGSAGPS